MLIAGQDAYGSGQGQRDDSRKAQVFAQAQNDFAQAQNQAIVTSSVTRIHNTLRQTATLTSAVAQLRAKLVGHRPPEANGTLTGPEPDGIIPEIEARCSSLDPAIHDAMCDIDAILRAVAT